MKHNCNLQARALSFDPHQERRQPHGNPPLLEVTRPQSPKPPALRDTTQGCVHRT